ncbi:sodium:proton antiporter [Rossellomorea vietnamensis]|uniref:Sodium:proton antiporter n=1 Tax=Rossellomorea vietnamensis TaxID=218284 RepID=A0A5D4KCY5_9BACI|nr:sodium:proton antiporter [Rossellomorea vietnamensis]TYR74013.1 sodium:proton antiporter [Rossellomorea vietnamensis]
MGYIHVFLLLFIGYVVFTIDKKQKNFPVPMVLLLIGIGLSFTPFFSSVAITRDMIFNVFLPALLFISAYQFKTAGLRKNIGVISVLSTLGLVLTVFILGVSIYFVGLVSLSFMGALLIASILTPTDPVSVVSILKKSSNSPKIADVVEGESMLNDGTSVVLFTVIAHLYISGEQFQLTSALGDFLLVSAGGLIIGMVFGWIASKVLHFTHHRQYQVMLSIVLAYGSFYLAEHLGVSGVLASVSAGAMLSWKLDTTNKEEDLRNYLDSFWEVIEPSILSILFLLIGIEFMKHFDFQNIGFIFIIFGLSLIVRFIVLAGILKMFRLWRQEFLWDDISLITWSGIKGTMSVALLLGLAAEKAGQTDTILSLTYGAIVLSLLIQSPLVYPLSRWFSKQNS